VSRSGILNVVNPLRHIPGMEKPSKFIDKIADPDHLGLGIFDEADLGNPPGIEDPNAILEREAENSAIAGDIAARNARMRSSTLGAGSRFIKQQAKSRPKSPSIGRPVGLHPGGAGTWRWYFGIIWNKG